MQRGRAIFVLAIAMLAACPLEARDMSIGVMGLFHPKRMQVRTYRESWVVFAGCGKRIVLDPDRNAGGATLTIAGSEVQVAYGGESFRCAAVDIESREATPISFELSVPGKLRRKYVGFGKIEVRQGELVAIVRLDLETAVASVLEAETDVDTPVEALRAEAIAVRSYFVGDSSGHRDFDFCDTTHCQFLRDTPEAGSRGRLAAGATAGMVLLYESAVVPAMYSASCGGRTRSLEDIGIKAQGYPFYAVECRYCREHAATWKRDEKAVRTESERLAIGRRHGWSAIPGNNYRVVDDGGAKILEGRGSGHGVGLCEVGAADMARNGADYRAILAHYFPNTRLEVIHDQRAAATMPAR